MPIERVANVNYIDFVRSSEYLVLVIGRQSCIDCEAYHTIINAISKKASRDKLDIFFGEVYLDDKGLKTGLILDHLKIELKEVPTTVLYKDGKNVFHFGNIRDNTYVRNNIEKYLGVKI